MKLNLVFEFFMWRNIYVTLVLAISSWGLTELVLHHNYPFLTLFARITQLHVFFFIGTNVLIKINNTLQDDLVQDWSLKDEHLVPHIKSFVQNFNYFTKLFIQELEQGKFKILALIVFLSQLMVLLGKKYTAISLIRFTSFLVFFIPRIYEWKSQEVQGLYEKLKGEYEQKVPPQYQNVSYLFILGTVSKFV